MLLKIDHRHDQTRARERGWLRQDIPAIVLLAEKLSLEYDPELAFNRQGWLNFYKSSFNDAWNYFHVVRIAECIVAIGGLSRSRIPKIDGILHSIYVEPEFRGYGFGRKVSEGVIKYARSVGMESLEMPVTKNKLARGLYERLGFELYKYDFEPHMFLALN